MKTLSRTESATAVRRLRMNLGMTQEQFAQRLDATYSTISRWENQFATPSKPFRKEMNRLASEMALPEPF